MSRLLSPEEVADRTPWCRDTVYKLCKNGKLPAKKIGGRWLISASVLTVEAPQSAGESAGEPETPEQGVPPTKSTQARRSPKSTNDHTVQSLADWRKYRASYAQEDN